MVGPPIAGDWPETAKIQVLLPYTCAEDALVDVAVRKLVTARLNSSRSPKLTPALFAAFLSEEQEAHPEIAGWSETVYSRWLSSFRSSLRAYGFMKRHPSLRLMRAVVRVDRPLGELATFDAGCHRGSPTAIA